MEEDAGKRYITGVYLRTKVRSGVVVCYLLIDVVVC